MINFESRPCLQISVEMRAVAEARQNHARMSKTEIGVLVFFQQHLQLHERFISRSCQVIVDELAGRLSECAWVSFCQVLCYYVKQTLVGLLCSRDQSESVLLVRQRVLLVQINTLPAEGSWAIDPDKETCSSRQAASSARRMNHWFYSLCVVGSILRWR